MTAMRQMTLTSGEIIVGDTGVGINVDAWNAAAAVKGIDIWPGREKALEELKGSISSDVDDLQDADDHSVAGFLLMHRFLVEADMSLDACNAIVEDAFDERPPTKRPETQTDWVDDEEEDE